MDMTAAVKTETTTIYQRVAELVCPPGLPKKAMDEKVGAALGGYPLWRIRACRLGEGGCFSAAAVFNLQQAYLAFMGRHQARVAAAEATERARQVSSDRAAIEKHLAHYRAEAAKLESRLAHLQETDAADAD